MTGDPRLKVEKSDAEWRAQLTPEQYYVARMRGTERAFTGAHWNTVEPGLYFCVCCNRPLFSSQAKFESGTGWPSFTEPVGPEAVQEHSDKSYVITRTEVRCADCGAHLGHVFRDGPRPTGLRYCMNGTALRFQPRDEASSAP